MRKTILTAALVCAFLGAQAQEYYEKQVTFPRRGDFGTESGYGFPPGAHSATVGMATNGVYRFPAFWHQYVYRQ